jgi:RecT family.
MANELVRTNDAGTALAAPPAPVTEEQILRALNLNPNSPKTQALVLTCRRYNLDPLLKHALLIGGSDKEGGSLYVTRDGLLHVAHASGRFDGIEVQQEPPTETHFVATATVWRKDMARPIRYQGRYPKSGRLAASYGPEMAEKVAECRALRRAFDVSLCSREEMWDEIDPEEGQPQGQPQAPRQQQQRPVVTAPRQSAAPAPPPAQTREVAQPAPPAPNNGDSDRQRLIAAFVDAAGAKGLELSDKGKRRTAYVALMHPAGDAPDRLPTNEEWAMAAAKMNELTDAQAAMLVFEDPFAEDAAPAAPSRTNAIAGGL